MPDAPSHLALLTALAVLGLGTGCVSQPENSAPREWQDWRERRLESVGGTNGWSTLVGLLWLQPGTNWIHVSTPTGSVVAGLMVRTGREVHFEAAPLIRVTHEGNPVTRTPLRSDAGGADPDVLAVGTVRFFLIERGERLGVRFKDFEAPARRQFSGIELFPYRSEWRLEGRFEAAPSPRFLKIQDVTGESKPEPCPGRLGFQVLGQEVFLDALWDEETQDYFVLFRDQTAGKTTYGSGRFLHVAREDAAGRVILDFNFAYTPPCAFTAFATCPLPPRSNWLPFSIPAGERAGRAPGH